MLTLPVLLSALSRHALHSIASRLTRCLREERLDDFFQVDALAFRAVHLLRLVLLDGQHFVKFVMTRAANVFVKGHRSVRLGVENQVWFLKAIILKPILSKVVTRLPFLAEVAP